MVLSRPPTQGFTAMDRYVSVEGAYRSAKTTTAFLWGWSFVLGVSRHPLAALTLDR